MDKLTRLTSDDRANLTAYLDGELDESSTRRIETILASSTVAREDVEALARTYEMLDVLPRPKAPTEFAERTVATAKLEGLKRPLSHRPWFRAAQRGAILGAWTLALVLAAVGGYAATHHWWTQPDDLLLDDFPVIQNADVYSEIGDVEFLQRLANERELVERIRGGKQP